MNQMRTAFLMAAMTGLLVVCGYLLAGSLGLLVALLFAAVGNFIAYWNSDSLVLRLYQAQPVGPQDAPDLYRMVADLAARADLPMPKLYLLQQSQPNAFATGRDPDHAAVAVTQGLVQLLTRQELAGVIAHELAHIKHRDTLTMTITATLAGAVSSLGNIFFFGQLFGGRDRQNPLGGLGALLVLVLGPLAALLLQMGISRGREYVADQTGAAICGNPLWLAQALAKIEAQAKGLPNATAERNPATAPLFIINPLHGGGMGQLFSTHPATASRIARLQAMADAMGVDMLDKSLPAPPEKRNSKPTRRSGIPPSGG